MSGYSEEALSQCLFNGVVGGKRAAGDPGQGLASDTPASALGQFLQRLCLVRASPSQLLPPIVWEPKESLGRPPPPTLSANPLNFQPSQPTSTVIKGGAMCDLDLEPQGGQWF